METAVSQSSRSRTLSNRTTLKRKLKSITQDEESDFVPDSEFSEDDLNFSTSKREHHTTSYFQLVDGKDQDISNSAEEQYGDSPQNGVIRVGLPPCKKQKIVHFVEKLFAERFVQDKVRYAYKETDRVFEGTTREEYDREEENVREHLIQRLIIDENGLASRQCDYSGETMSWTTGPQSVSIEAVFPTAAFNGRFAYHTRQNATTVMSTLNYAKARCLVLVLPLAAVCMRGTLDDSKASSQSFDWSLIALMNVLTMTRAFGFTSMRSDILKNWTDMTREKREAIFEACRTGILSPELSDKIQNLNVATTFTSLGNATKIASKSNSKSAKDVNELQSLMPVLEAIAMQHGLSAEEFEYYFTINSPTGGKMFFPFHVSCRVLAEELKWDWHTWARTLKESLRTLRKNCNRNAEKSGQSEANVTTKQIMCWMAAYFSRKVQRLKLANPSLTPTEIRKKLSDRFSLPIVPWVWHPFRFSFCKGPDHGLVMIFGFTNGDHPFDPLRHIDLDLCTIEIDCRLTNFAMQSWSTSDWATVRQTLLKVPLNHSFWRPHPSLRMKVWVGKQDLNMAPSPPIPEMEMALMPSRFWLETSDECLPSVLCNQCSIELSSPGQLIHHHRTEHATHSESMIINQIISEAALDTKRDQWKQAGVYHCHICKEYSIPFYSQDDLDTHILEAHATSQQTCYECQSVLESKFDLWSHLREAHPELPLFQCDICGELVQTTIKLAEHKALHASIRQHFTCYTCGISFPSKVLRSKHYLIHDTGRSHIYEECGDMFTNHSLLREHHHEAHTAHLKYECPQCKKRWLTPASLELHMASHSEDKPFKCTAAGCEFKSRLEVFVTRHYQSIHVAKPGDSFPCQVARCKKVFDTRFEYSFHQKQIHNNVGPFDCREDGCGRKYIRLAALRKHLREDHP